MKPKQLLNITLPNEMAEAIKTKAQAGEYVVAIPRTLAVCACVRDLMCVN
jgi:hypothetical protein